MKRTATPLALGAQAGGGRPRVGLPMLVAALLLPLFSLGQHYSTESTKAVKAFQKGEAAIQRGAPAEAMPYFEQALLIDPHFSEAHLMLADWLFDLGQLEQARGHYEAFLEVDVSNKRYHASARKRLETIDFRLYSRSHPAPFEPENLGPGVNTNADEYLPALTVDGRTMVFTRRIVDEDFYQSQLTASGWSQAVRLPEPINTPDNEGAQCLSQEGRVLFFTACGREDGAGRCDLYMCVRKGDKWSKPRNLGSPVNTGAWESQPSFSVDGRTLYFVSDRKGGYGGLDIWSTTFTGRGWSAPVNLGPNINTEGDEMSPFIHFDDRTLYFASNGHVGMGGQDLFVARRAADSSWEAPVNLGYPINTEGDETNLIVDADGRTAYFSSDRAGGYGRQDLYRFDLPEALRPLPALATGDTAAPVQPLESGQTLTLRNVLFATASADLDSASFPSLTRLADLLKAHAELRCEVAGHTDNVGHPDANQRLSEQRAQSVVRFLTARGVPPERLTAHGYGESQPVASNETDAGRALNRRTELRVL